MVRTWRWLVMSSLLVALAMATATALATAPSAGAPYRVQVGQPFVNVIPVGFWVAEEEGFFKKHGVDVEIITFRGSTQAMQALLASQIPVLMASPAGALAAAAQGGDVVEVASLGPRMPYLLVVRPEIQRIEDLKGRPVGTSGAGLSAARMALLIIFRHFGLNTRQDRIALVPAGTGRERLAALVQGGIYATVLESGTYQALAEEQGMRILFNLSELDVPWDHDVLLSSRRYLSANQPAMEALLKGLLEANAFILNPANKARIVQIIGRRLGFGERTDLAEDSYDEAVRLFVRRKPYPNVEALRVMIEEGSAEVPALKKVDLTRFVDDSILRRLDNSGFIDGLGR